LRFLALKEISGRQKGTVHSVTRSLLAVLHSPITSQVDNIGSSVISTA